MLQSLCLKNFLLLKCLSYFLSVRNTQKQARKKTPKTSAHLCRRSKRLYWSTSDATCPTHTHTHHARACVRLWPSKKSLQTWQLCPIWLVMFELTINLCFFLYYLLHTFLHQFSPIVYRSQLISCCNFSVHPNPVKWLNHKI